MQRLQDKKQTVYWDHKKFAYVFTNASVHKVFCEDNQCVDALNEPTASCCGLVNICWGLDELSEPFCPCPSHLGRVVVASSLNPAHLMAFRECPVKTYTLPTWTWDNLYCTRWEQKMVAFVDCANPEIHSVILRDGQLMAPSDKKLLEMFMRLCWIPQRCFQALFREELEHEAIKNAN